MIACHQCGQAIRHKREDSVYLYNSAGRIVGTYLYLTRNGERWLHVKCVADYNSGKERVNAKASAKK